MKIYTITHKEFIAPESSTYIPLHVGHIKYSDGTLPEGSEDFGYMGDDTGDNISSKNNLYSELTGLYWMWKNAPDCDYLGLVHYRRYFASDDGRLLTESDVRNLMKESDILIANHIEYDRSYEEEFAQYHHAGDLIKTGEAIKKLYPEYYDTFLSVIHGNKQYVFNMMITSRELLNAYAKWLFDICFELEKVIDVSGYDNYRARIYGFLSEELLFVWIKYNKLRYKELPVVYSQEKAETIEFKKNLRSMIKTEGFDKAYEYFLKVFNERPDLSLDDSDFTHELRVILYILEYADRYKGELDSRYFEDYFRRFKAIDSQLTELIQRDFNPGDEAEKYRSVLLGLNDKELDIICSRNAIFNNNREQIKKSMSDLFSEEYITFQVLYYDPSMLEAAKDSILNLKAVKLPVYNIELIDAFGDAGAEAFDNAVSDGLLTIRRIDDIDFDGLPALKNAALSLARHNRICQIEAGTVFDKGEIIDFINSRPLMKNEASDLLLRKGVFAAAVMIFDRRALNETGGFNERLKSAEDYELALRIADSDYRDFGIEFINCYEAEVPIYKESFECYAYCLSRYAAKLKNKGIFDEVFGSLYEQAKSYGIAEYFVECAEKLMPKGEAYKKIEGLN